MDLKHRKSELRQLVCDLVFVLGACVFVYGLGLAWRPMGFIVAGLLIAAIAFFIGYRRN